MLDRPPGSGQSQYPQPTLRGSARCHLQERAETDAGVADQQEGAALLGGSREERVQNGQVGVAAEECAHRSASMSARAALSAARPDTPSLP
ncbi:hypothetical protein Abr02nite_83960 [Paractinoplanes brasiliensis]|nr:hypothetical protein Abr02nite_83960 [Actinoplanes brasiliensis]